MRSRKLLLFFLLSYPLSLWADGSQIIVPSAVGATVSGDLAYINLQEAETVSSCTKHTQLRWSLDTAGGRAALSVAMTAFTTGKSIRVWLTGNCSSDFPVPSWIEMVE